MQDGVAFEKAFQRHCQISQIHALLMGARGHCLPRVWGERSRHACPLTNLPQPALSMIVEEMKGVDLEGLQHSAWHGIPTKLRPLVYQLLLGVLPITTPVYLLNTRGKHLFLDLPTPRARRLGYFELVRQCFEIGDTWPHTEAPLNPAVRFNEPEMRLITADASRRRLQHTSHPLTSPSLSIRQAELAEQMLCRVLFVLLYQHPLVVYAQGLVQLVHSFMMGIFDSMQPGELWNEGEPLPPTGPNRSKRTGLRSASEVMANIEADVYAMASTFLSRSRAFQEESIQVMIDRLEMTVKRVDPNLATHFHKHRIMFPLFAFKWLQGMMLTEFQQDTCMRLLDTYLSVPPAELPNFATHVVVSVLLTHSVALQQLSFPMAMLYLQRLPNPDVQELTAKAFELSQQFPLDSAHLNPTGT